MNISRSVQLLYLDSPSCIIALWHPIDRDGGSEEQAALEEIQGYIGMIIYEYYTCPS